jgi:HEAT repeat protein
MNDAPSSAENPSAPADRPLPDHLPPVEPPSAGFIVQLFLVPAIIVAVVVAGYLFFSRLAAGETDWRQLVSDIKSDNTHVRWHAALNLAEALDAEAARGKTANRLAETPEIAVALNDLAVELLKSTTRNEETSQQLQYALKAVGRMDVPDAVWPSLSQALEEKQDVETRKQALQAIAMMAGRQREKQAILEVPGLVDVVIGVSMSGEPVLRQHAAFALGLIPTGPSDARMSVLLEDSDEMTRINAAIGFAREGSSRGMQVFLKALNDTEAWAKSPATDHNVGDRAFERQLILKNVLHAIEILSPKLAESERDELGKQLEALESAMTDPGLRLAVKQARLHLEKRA